MFGLVVADMEKLSLENQQVYRACYCGICRSIRERYGSFSSLVLSYDLTLLPLLFEGLYSAEQRLGLHHCPMHPLKARNMLYSEFTDYAADMNLLLMYYKLLDDWNDDRDILKYGLAQSLKSKLQTVQHRYPRQNKAITDCLGEIAAIEKNGDPAPDAAAHWFGVLMGEMMWLKRDPWTETLQKFGYHLGKAIYYMDAEIDLQQDLRKKRYNPFTFVSGQNRLYAVRCSLSEATEQLSLLPVRQNAALLENILYQGIWKKYSLKHKGESCHDERPLSDTGRTDDGNG